MDDLKTLIPVSYDNPERPTVSGRELHEFLKVNTPYRIWFPRMVEYGFTEGEDFNPYKNVRVQSEGNREVERTIDDHQLTIPMAKELCMIQRNERGKQARQYFLAVEAQCGLKLSKEMQALFMLDNRTQRQEERLTALENTMTVDYNQQRVLRKAISRAVIGALGGEDTPAYIDNHVRSKVYSECNHDVQDWFRVNSVGNIPRKRFDEAVEYIQRWKPSTNTVMLIQQTNGQTSLFAAAAAQRNTTTAGKFVKEV